MYVQRVAGIVTSETDNEEVIVADWMHDMLDDITSSNAYFNEDRIKNIF